VDDREAWRRATVTTGFLEGVEGPAQGSDGQVTLVILTFDRPDYLEQCLASVRRQALEGFRLVVVDNASAADYPGVLDHFRELPMSYIRNETNIGGPIVNVIMPTYNRAAFVGEAIDGVLGQILAAGGLVGVCPGIDDARLDYMIGAFGRFMAGERVPVGCGLSGAPARAER
jgi:hypothetical protein